MNMLRRSKSEDGGCGRILGNFSRRAAVLAALCAGIAGCEDEGGRYDKDPKGNVILKEDKARIDPEDRSERVERRVDETE